MKEHQDQSTPVGGLVPVVRERKLLLMRSRLVSTAKGLLWADAVTLAAQLPLYYLHMRTWARESRIEPFYLVFENSLTLLGWVTVFGLAGVGMVAVLCRVVPVLGRWRVAWVWIVGLLLMNWAATFEGVKWMTAANLAVLEDPARVLADRGGHSGL